MQPSSLTPAWNYLGVGRWTFDCMLTLYVRLYYSAIADQERQL